MLSLSAHILNTHLGWRVAVILSARVSESVWCAVSFSQMLKQNWSDRSSGRVTRLLVCQSERVPTRAQLLFVPLASHAKLHVSPHLYKGITSLQLLFKSVFLFFLPLPLLKLVQTCPYVHKTRSQRVESLKWIIVLTNLWPKPLKSQLLSVIQIINTFNKDSSNLFTLLLVMFQNNQGSNYSFNA